VVFLVCYVHAINTEAHPMIPPGFRWAVMVGDVQPSDLARCANAHWAPTREAAAMEGDRNLATAVKAMQMVGVGARYGGVRFIDHDPNPAGADRLNFV
jgi:hypothetical protein